MAVWFAGPAPLMAQVLAKSKNYFSASSDTVAQDWCCPPTAVDNDSQQEPSTMLSALDSASIKRRSRKFSLAAASSAHWNRRESSFNVNGRYNTPNGLDPMDEDPNETGGPGEALDSSKEQTGPGFDDAAAMAAVKDDEETRARALEQAEKERREEDAIREKRRLAEEAGRRESKQREEDLIVEIFGFPPIEFVDEVIDIVNTLMYDAMEEFQSFVEGELDDQIEVEKGMAALETLLENAIDKNFDKYEVYALQNIFSFPPNVDIVLPQYKDVDPNATEEVDAALDEEIERMRKELIRVGILKQHVTKYAPKERVINERLKRINAILDCDIPRIQKIQAAIKAGVTGGNMSQENIKQALERLQEQIEKLRTISELVKARSSITPSSAQDAKPASSSTENESNDMMDISHPEHSSGLQRSTSTPAETVALFLANRRRLFHPSENGKDDADAPTTRNDKQPGMPPWKTLMDAFGATREEREEVVRQGFTPEDFLRNPVLRTDGEGFGEQISLV
ncbi:hypothetical protein HDU96_008072 [Phlyctochytrium bullatum]|nr:hypothetical protein HDU96_008072 [Phlyctochytrium bullatum]